MPKMVEHEGYIIQSIPQHQADQDKWRLRILISFEDERGVRSREFSPDGMYATEHEADIHGTTLGQRIIDGKVEGQYVEDMKADDRRAMPRLRVQFRTTFSTATKLEGTGYILDLSLGGCRIESSVTTEPASWLELRIYPPHSEWPLMIEAASVQWASGQTFGLAFSKLSYTEQQLLGEVVNDLIDGGSSKGQIG